MTSSRWRAAATMSAWSALLVGAMRWLLEWQPTPTAGVTTGLDPVVITMNVVRAAALVLGGYLLAVVAMAVIVRVLRLPGFVVGFVERLAPSALRHLLRTFAGVAMTTAATASPALAAPAASAPAGVLIRGAERPADLPSTDEAVVMHRLPDVDEAPSPVATDGAAASSGTTSRVVAPGDHFWSIAEEHLASLLGRSVTDAEVDPFWRAVVEANRSLTPDPDLLVPGQVVQLPAVP